LLAAGCVAIGVSSQPMHYAPWAEVVVLILPFVFPLSHVIFPFDAQSPSDMLASHAQVVIQSSLAILLAKLT
jgi:hypothetical protein